jgi:hypothetical protein
VYSQRTRYPLYEYHLERFFGTSIVIAAERQEARQDGEFPSSGDIEPVRKFVERHSQLGLSCFSRHDSDEEDVFSSSMSRTIADRARAS